MTCVVSYLLSAQTRSLNFLDKPLFSVMPLHDATPVYASKDDSPPNHSFAQKIASSTFGDLLYLVDQDLSYSSFFQHRQEVIHNHIKMKVIQSFFGSVYIKWPLDRDGVIRTEFLIEMV